MTRQTASLADEVLLRLSGSDRRAAADYCRELVAAGMPLTELVVDGLAPAMRQVGQLWEAAVWSVVDEHTATGVAERALSAASDRAGGGGGRASRRGDLVVGCVEGDWHSLPSRMVAELLEEAGWSVRFLGASHPTGVLLEHVRRHRPDAVVLTCSVPMALPTLVSAVDLLHRAGTPVFVGGRALGADGRRARAVGADGWAGDAGAAVALLAGSREPGPEASAVAALPAHHARTRLLPDWSERGMACLEADVPPARRLPAAVRERARLDLLHVLEMAAVAVLLDDPALVAEECRWLRGVLDARGVAAGALTRSIDALVHCRPDERSTEAVTDQLLAVSSGQQ